MVQGADAIIDDSNSLCVMQHQSHVNESSFGTILLLAAA